MTLDPVLLEDIIERLRCCRGFEHINLVRPAAPGRPIGPEDILKIGRDTTASRIIILDIRRNTRARLQRAYSDIVRFNRPDLNQYCYTVLVGDGPVNFLQPDRGIKTMAPFLAELRIDYSAAAFFGDPFLYYTMEEMQDMAIHHQGALPDKLSGHFTPYFKGDLPAVAQVRKYFRAADKQGHELAKKKKERHTVLKNLVTKIILDQFPNGGPNLEKALSKEGLDFPGEMTRCYIYPFHFTQKVLELLTKAQNVNDTKKT
jgi:hypothetical protein